MPKRIKRTERFTVRVNPAEMQLIEAAAEAEMRRTGEFVRTIVVPAARRVLSSAPERIGAQG